MIHFLYGVFQTKKPPLQDNALICNIRSKKGDNLAKNICEGKRESRRRKKCILCARQNALLTLS